MPFIQNSRIRNWRYRGITAAAAIGVAVGAASAGTWHSTEAKPLEAAAPARAAGAAARTIGNGVDSYADLVDRVSPAVVTIHAEGRTRAPQQFPFLDDPLFRRFFGDRGELPEMPRQRRAALGSGVIVRADGYILTNQHVIDGAEKITVELADRRRLSAKLIGSDAPSDLAVLKIEADGIQALPLGDSDVVEVGDVVLALGNPLGVGQTVTMGIISAKGRATGLGDGSFEDFLQTDAPINSGNSGGALVNTRGELVGINSQILTPSGGNIGIGFAIPASMASNVLEQLIESGKVRRAQLGVTAQTIDSALARSLGLSDVRGALVSDIASGSAAERAGLRRGDVILAVDGDPIADSNALRNRIASTKPGTAVALTVVRDGSERKVNVPLGELQTGDRAAQTTGTGEQNGFGLGVEPLTKERARDLGVSTDSGVLVQSVSPGSPAADAGFRTGDVIEQVDGRPVDSLDELRSALNATPERPALVLVHRKDQTLFLTLSRG